MTEIEAHAEGQDSYDLLEAAAKYLTKRGYYLETAGGISVEEQNGKRRLVIQFSAERVQ